MDHMKKDRIATRLAVTLSLSIIAILPLSDAASARDHGRTGAAISGFIAGTAITAALSPRQVVVNRDIYVPAYAPPVYPSDSFSPTAGIICYASQFACYTMGGGYNPKWTWSVFAR